MLCYMTGGDRKLFGDASYQLGLAFINNGDPQTALMVQNFRVFSVIQHDAMYYCHCRCWMDYYYYT